MVQAKEWWKNDTHRRLLLALRKLNTNYDYKTFLAHLTLSKIELNNAWASHNPACRS
jgi:hypothetical protein